MSPATKPTSMSSFGGFDLRSVQSRSQIFQAVLVTAIAGLMFWLVWLYASSLRDARYLDGWLLTAAMAFQVAFHIRRKMSKLAPTAAQTWRQAHIFVGYIVVALFISHSDISLPDTYFEWALWLLSVLVLLSGVVGTYLAWAVQAKLRADDEVVLDRIPKKRAEIARKIHELATTKDNVQLALELPVAPYKEWILDFYKNHLKAFVQKPRHSLAHMVGSQRHMKGLLSEMDELERYVDKSGREKLREMKALVIEKDRLDFARVQLWLSRAWTMLHVPFTYSLVVLIVLHILVVYSYSSGVW